MIISFPLFLIETMCCDPDLNHLIEMVQTKGHNICFYAELTKIIHNYCQIIPLISEGYFQYLFQALGMGWGIMFTSGNACL